VTAAAFSVRGVVEGFYGWPWSHPARLDMLTFLGDHDMNAYVYAPKDDLKHRTEWREAYTADEMRSFAALVERSRDVGVRFGFAISPGLDIDYESVADRADLLTKLRALAAVGVDWFVLALDDIPMRDGLAGVQAALAAFVLGELGADADDVRLTLCPTEYVGTCNTPYLDTLAEELPPSVDIMWTGRTVCSPTITAAEASARAAALDGRAPLIWDNFPVNDATMTASLHLGPYRGRDAELASVCTGVLCNPMSQPRASMIAIGTAAAFLSDPSRYDAGAAWRAVIDEVGGDHAAPLAVLANACADSPIERPQELELFALVDQVQSTIDGPDWPVAVGALADVLRAARALPDDFGSDSDLAREIRPWAEAARTEANAGIAALKLLQQIRLVGGVAPDAETAMQHAFATMFAWGAARRNEHVVFGPRFALYTPVIQLADGRPGLDIDAALREDDNAIDALCRLALAKYAAWTENVDAYETHGDHAPPFRDRRIP
jgi:hyaluronoglucosaminidase